MLIWFGFVFLLYWTFFYSCYWGIQNLDIAEKFKQFTHKVLSFFHTSFLIPNRSWDQHPTGLHTHQIKCSHILIEKRKQCQQNTPIKTPTPHLCLNTFLTWEKAWDVQRNLCLKNIYISACSSHHNERSTPPSATATSPTEEETSFSQKILVYHTGLVQPSEDFPLKKKNRHTKLKTIAVH